MIFVNVWYNTQSFPKLCIEQWTIINDGSSLPIFVHIWKKKFFRLLFTRNMWKFREDWLSSEFWQFQSFNIFLTKNFRSKILPIVVSNKKMILKAVKKSSIKWIRTSAPFYLSGGNLKFGNLNEVQRIFRRTSILIEMPTLIQTKQNKKKRNGWMWCVRVNDYIRYAIHLVSNWRCKSKWYIQLIICLDLHKLKYVRTPKQQMYKT